MSVEALDLHSGFYGILLCYCCQCTVSFSLISGNVNVALNLMKRGEVFPSGRIAEKIDIERGNPQMSDSMFSMPPLTKEQRQMPPPPIGMPLLGPGSFPQQPMRSPFPGGGPVGGPGSGPIGGPVGGPIGGHIGGPVGGGPVGGGPVGGPPSGPQGPMGDFNFPRPPGFSQPPSSNSGMPNGLGFPMGGGQGGFSHAPGDRGQFPPPPGSRGGFEPSPGGFPSSSSAFNNAPGAPPGGPGSNFPMQRASFGDSLFGGVQRPFMSS